MEIITPLTFVLFGATGDLAQRKIVPSLLRLFEAKKLPDDFTLIAFSRRHWGNEDYRTFIYPSLILTALPEESIRSFLKHIVYVKGTFDNPESYSHLHAKLIDVDSGRRFPSQKIYHIAAQSDFYEVILQGLEKAKLNFPINGEKIDPRIIIEKPFGRDSVSAEFLAEILDGLFSKDQIYLIDHYLGKPGALELLELRKHDEQFESRHSSEFISSIKVRLLESIDIEGRGEFYDVTGALRDVGQNHILQMIALTAMTIPQNEQLLSHAREKSINSIIPIDTSHIKKYVVRGQYEGYKNETDVATTSNTETYFSILFYMDDERWKDVEFTIEGGKALGKKVAEIEINYKDKTQRIIRLEGKEEKNYQDAYEFLIYQAFIGYKPYFVSIEEVLAAWRVLTPILECEETIPLRIYKKGIYPLEII